MDKFNKLANGTSNSNGNFNGTGIGTFHSDLASGNGDAEAKDQTAKVLQEITSVKEKKKEIKSKGNERANKHMERKINSLGSDKRQSVRDFINKTREIILTKYSINIKKERAIRLQETYSNEVESIKDSIFSMQEARKLFEKDFIIKFEEYIKHLVIQREKEKTDENNLLEDKMKLDNENKKLQNKINKLEEKQIQYEEYREFMIRLKEKLLKIPEEAKPTFTNTNNNLNNVNNVNTARSRDISISPANNSVYITTSDFQKKARKSIISKIDIEQVEQNERIKSYYKNEHIFESTQELMDEMKKMEANNIAKLAIYNQKNLRQLEAEKELKRLKDDDSALSETSNTEVDSKEKQLKKLISRHKKLLDEKHLLSIENTSEENNKNSKRDRSKSRKLNFMKSKYFEPQLYSKILEVYESCLEYIEISDNPEYFERNNNTKKGGPNNEVDIKMLDMLRDIEKSLVNLIAYYEQFKSTNEKRLQMKEKSLEESWKLKKNKDVLIEKQLDQQRKRIEFEERNNKIYIIPKRKVDCKCPPRDTQDKENKKNDNENREPNFEDFISF